MSRLDQLSHQNERALKFRAEETKNDPHKFRNLSLKQLLTLPSYTGFVEGEFIDGVSFVMFVCDKDDGVALRILWKREFEAASMSLWRRLIPDAQLVVDVGGHTGIYSIVAGLAHPLVKVHTFEPHEMNFGRMLLNLRANGLPATYAHSVAASRKVGVVPFRVKISHYLSSGGSVVAEDENFTKNVPARTVDSMLNLSKAPRACVKIDTEGHEVEVLGGMRALLALQPDIILECGFTKEMTETEQALRSNRLGFFFIDDDRWTIEELASLTSPPHGVGPKDRVNVLVTARSSGEVTEIFNQARLDYERAFARIRSLT